MANTANLNINAQILTRISGQINGLRRQLRDAQLQTQGALAAKRSRSGLNRGEVRNRNRPDFRQVVGQDAGFGSNVAGALAARFAAPFVAFKAFDKYFELAGSTAQAVVTSQNVNEFVKQRLEAFVPEFMRPIIRRQELELKREFENLLDAFRVVELEALRAEIKADRNASEALSAVALDRFANSPEGRRMLVGTVDEGY